MSLDPIVSEILDQLKATFSPANIEGMRRFGITADKAFGTSKPDLRKIARPFRKQHALALKLWREGYLETRIMAAWIDDPPKVTEHQMEAWVKEFDSWDICDQCTSSLFCKTPFAWDKALEWSNRLPEFEKRAGFALMAALAVHDKKAPDANFLPLLERIKTETDDGRNFVKKAANWALR